MNNYNVEVCVRREKVLIIKMIRRICNWGLKDCKDWVEANFTFDSYMENTATFEMRMTSEQLGDLTHFAIQNFSRLDITETTVISADVHDPFDFRSEEHSNLAI